MALETLAVNRFQIFYENALSLTAGQTIPEGEGGAAGLYPINDCSGLASIQGIISATKAPAAGFPRIRFWPGAGDVTALTAIAVYGPGSGFVTADPNNANTWVISADLLSPYVTIELTQGTSTGTITGVVWAFPEAGNAVGAGGGSTPVTLPAPPTYRVPLSGLVFGSAGGQFLELRNPATSGKVLRVTAMQFYKPSVTVRWQVQVQSALSTGGASTTPTPTTADQNNAAAVGVVKLYTTASTAGASVGFWLDQSTTAADIYVDEPGENTGLDEPIVVRPGQSVGWMSDVAFTGNGYIEWSENSS